MSAHDFMAEQNEPQYFRRVGLGGPGYQSAHETAEQHATRMDWAAESEGRIVTVRLPDRAAVPAWCLAAIFAAAPEDAVIYGIREMDYGMETVVALQSVTFPKLDREPLTTAMTIAATWDFETRHVAVAWPKRGD